eukprot:GFUD01062989.1.p1 GENE.GFUD01062989.1~~GFUD01062989.1.p1  ORF type:complete len:170 (-),score=21.91 GFUD01062989.1:20-529(-)
MQTTEKMMQTFVKSLSRSFLFLSTVSHCLSGVLLIITGAWQISWTVDVDEYKVDLYHLSTYLNFCWIIIISGMFLLLWTLAGWIVFMRKSIKLDITCGVSNCILIVLFYFIFCSQHPDLHPDNNIIFLLLFCTAILSSIVHSLLILGKCSTSNRKDELQDDEKRSEINF